MNNSKFKIQYFLFIFCFIYFAFGTLNVFPQSTNQNFPTSITTNEIGGNIPARDVGDARLTTYFYAFKGSQGDVFVNVLTANLNGSIDIFTTDNLRPLTKITVYSSDAENETGRVVYLRKPEKLILRVEGRSPNDDAATFKIKFAGSFQPLEATAENAAPPVPEVKTENQSNIRVNSVGTIIEVRPKEVYVKEEEKDKIEAVTENKKETKESLTKAEIEAAVENQVNNAPKVIITEEIVKQDTVKVEKAPVENKVEKVNKTEAAASPEGKTDEEIIAKITPKTKIATKKNKKEKAIEPNPLENIRLNVLFKDGTKIEYPMSEVIKMGVDKGILTIILKDGGGGRYSILNVAKMTIE
jgi:hypothetical protein